MSLHVVDISIVVVVVGVCVCVCVCVRACVCQSDCIAHFNCLYHISQLQFAGECVAMINLRLLTKSWRQQEQRYYQNQACNKN